MARSNNRKKNKMSLKITPTSTLCKENSESTFLEHDCMEKFRPLLWCGTGSDCLDTVAINDLLCMKNAGAQIAMDFS